MEFRNKFAGPKAPQRCRACGEMVQTFADWFSNDCPNARDVLPYRIGHDVPDPYRLPHFKEDNDAT